MNNKLYSEKIKEILDTIEKDFSNLKFRKKNYNTFLKILLRYISKVIRISDLDKRNSITLVYDIAYKKKYEKLTLEHILFLKKLINEIFNEKLLQSYLLNRIENMIYKDDKNLFINKENYKEPNESLYTIHKDLQCKVCKNIGAVQNYGKWHHRTNLMDHIVSFSGTVPYECLKCNNVGLYITSMESYEVTFDEIKKKVYKK